MQLNVGMEIAALRRMAVSELRARYGEVFGEATNANNKDWLIKRIAWRLQANEEGDLSERARNRAALLANDADLRLSPPKVANAATQHSEDVRVGNLQFHADDRLPLPGTIIHRVYKGEALQVKVLQRGFEFEGEVYKSLSAVAKKITSSHCNGYLFFRLEKGGSGDQA
jgi:hypothetical protein